jgi:hypothetical protein
MNKRTFLWTILAQIALFAIACFFQFIFLLSPVFSIGLVIAGIVYYPLSNDEDKSEKKKGRGMILSRSLGIIAQVLFIVILIKYGPNC